MNEEQFVKNVVKRVFVHSDLPLSPLICIVNNARESETMPNSSLTLSYYFVKINVV